MWKIEVTAVAHLGVRQLVLVDARLGAIALRVDEMAHAKRRRVCDGRNVRNAGLPCRSPVRTEGGAPSKVADVNDAYDNSGLVYDFFKRRLGRNSIDGKGMALISTVRACVRGYRCPLANASWDGTQMLYGAGYASNLDVVGHEFTHGITEHTSRLFYYAQSGAINESMSDVFGKFIQLTAQPVRGAKRWRIGAGIPGYPAGFRDLRRPPAFGSPDRMTSRFYVVGLNDYLGVHTNSGVGNKAAYLITDGGKFNGQKVKGLGIPKAAKLYYEVQRNFLISGSDYRDLANGLRETCRSLIGTARITLANCRQVDKAVAAVEMETDPPKASVERAPVCAPGSVPDTVSFDNFEKTARTNDRWVRKAQGPGRWYYPPGPAGNRYRFDATYARSGKRNLWGYGETKVSDARVEQRQSVTIPPNAYLRFDHAFEFQGKGSRTFDGGVVEYSSNGGASWSDAGALFTDGSGYNRTVDTTGGNPLKGRQAFGHLSFGYTASRLNLAPLAGMDVRFRFRIGSDRGGAWYGWFIDDVRIYTCEPV